MTKLSVRLDYSVGLSDLTRTSLEMPCGWHCTLTGWRWHSGAAHHSRTRALLTLQTASATRTSRVAHGADSGVRSTPAPSGLSDHLDARPHGPVCEFSLFHRHGQRLRRPAITTRAQRYTASMLQSKASALVPWTSQENMEMLQPFEKLSPNASELGHSRR